MNVHSRITDYDDESEIMKSPGPCRFTDSDNPKSIFTDSGVFESSGSFTAGNPASPDKDNCMPLKELEGLSDIEKAALELSMNKHRRAYNLLASD